MQNSLRIQKWSQVWLRETEIQSALSNISGNWSNGNQLHRSYEYVRDKMINGGRSFKRKMIVHTPADCELYTHTHTRWNASFVPFVSDVKTWWSSHLCRSLMSLSVPGIQTWLKTTSHSTGTETRELKTGWNSSCPGKPPK